MLAWVQATQPLAWESLQKSHGSAAETVLLDRLRAVRQLRYSLFNENAIDLVLFLNGIPVATEPLLDFPRGALVHFAASSREVQMTTGPAIRGVTQRETPAGYLTVSDPFRLPSTFAPSPA